MQGILRTLMVFSMCFSVACASSISPEAKQELASPVNCETAGSDIEALEAEKASVAKQVAAGVRTVLPAAVVVGILRRDMKDRFKVAAGVYNQEIDDKVVEIQQHCGL